MITGRFDGPSLILTLSAVKHLGKDNNSQFYDTVRGRGGCVFLSAFLILQNSPRKNAVNLGQRRSQPAFMKPTYMQFEQMESGCFFMMNIDWSIYTSATSPCATVQVAGRIEMTWNRATVRFLFIF